MPLKLACIFMCDVHLLSFCGVVGGCIMLYSVQLVSDKNSVTELKRICYSCGVE